VSRNKVGRSERRAVANMTVGDLDKIASALGATLQVQVRWQGEQLDRLLDAAHAALQEQVAWTLEHFGWLVRPEVSFNHFGDRGRVDIVAFHPRLRVLVIAEIKSGIGDLQKTIGRLDIKVRLAKVIAAEQGWRDVAAVIPALVIGDTRAARRTIAAHATLFTRFNVRGRQALAWLRRPIDPVPSGLLWFATRSNAHPMRKPSL
jgi:hypothetical protein